MLKRITWNPKNFTHSEGRNGYMKTIAIELMVIDNDIAIFPVNSKGNAGRAMIKFPMDSIDDVINELKKLKDASNS